MYVLTSLRCDDYERALISSMAKPVHRNTSFTEVSTCGCLLLSEWLLHGWLCTFHQVDF